VPELLYWARRIESENGVTSAVLRNRMLGLLNPAGQGTVCVEGIVRIVSVADFPTSKFWSAVGVAPEYQHLDTFRAWSVQRDEAKRNSFEHEALAFEVLLSIFADWWEREGQVAAGLESKVNDNAAGIRSGGIVAYGMIESVPVAVVNRAAELGRARIDELVAKGCSEEQAALSVDRSKPEFEKLAREQLHAEELRAKDEVIKEQARVFRGEHIANPNSIRPPAGGAKRKHTHLRESAIRHSEESERVSGRSKPRQRELYDLWIASIRNGRTKWQEGIEYPTFDTWRGWISHKPKVKKLIGQRHGSQKSQRNPKSRI
jgi:hypothetical protein